MKRRWIISIVVVVVMAVAAYLIVPEDKVAKVEVAMAQQEVNEFPSLNFMKLNGESMSMKNAEDKSIIIFFNPGCDHCQREAKQISSRREIFKDYTLYFLTVDSIQNIEKFSREYDLLDKNFIFGRAEGIDVYQSVGPLPSVPAFFIYNKKKLVKRIDGEVDVEEVQRYL